MPDLLISLVVIGLVAGVLARLVVPGKQGVSILMTTTLGIVGSIVGGFLGYLIFPGDAVSGFFQPAGIIGSMIGASTVLLIWTRTRTRSRATRARVNDRRTAA